MPILEALILGIVQGLTEFLPISSSAHLTMVPKLFQWKGILLNSLYFDVALHGGTLLAVVIYFWKELGLIIKKFIYGIVQQRPFEDEHAKLGWLIIIGTIPIVIIALAFKELIESAFRHPVMVASMLILFGLVMAWSEKAAKTQREIGTMNWKEALTIGVAQSLALMPGVSRSGITISSGLFLGFKRDEAAHYAFLLSIPSIIGATIFAVRDFIKLTETTSWVTMAIGTIAAAVAGYFCISFLLAFLKKRSLGVFVVYRVVFGLLVLGWYFWQVR